MSRCTECGSKGDCDEFCGESHGEMRDSILFLREENEKLKECVEFYADSKKWINKPVKPWISGFKFFENKNQNGFEEARKTLKELYDSHSTVEK